MDWSLLLAAGAFEIVFTYGLKLTQTSLTPVSLGITAVSALSSFGLLWLSLRTIPIGTAYAIWTGIGVIGAALIGMIKFNEPFTVARLACILLIAFGAIGLRMLGVEK